VAFSLERLLGACALALPLIIASTAEANAPAPFVREPPRLDGAFVAGPTTLVVEHEELSFRCDADGTRCSFEAVYHVRNDGDAPEEVLGAFYGIASRDVSVRVRGADARHAVTPEQLAVMDAAVHALDPTVGGGHPESLGRTGFALALEAHTRADLVFSGKAEGVIDYEEGPGGEFALPPLKTRHPLLSTSPQSEVHNDFAYALSPIRGWAGSPTIDVTVRFPRSLEWKAMDGTAWRVAPEGGETVARASIASASASVLRFRLIRPGVTLLSGGPMLGIGGRLDAKELRARLGYELADPYWLIYSAAVEASFHGRTTLVPVIEAATPDLAFIIPSWAFGLGVPVQVRSGEATLVGARAQVTVAFPFVSMVVPFDWFPGATGGDRTQISMMAQASF
jgi:hypothetical protein